MFEVKPNNTGGPGWYVVNTQGRTVCWVFEQPWGGPDEERAQAIADMLNATEQERREARLESPDFVG